MGKTAMVRYPQETRRCSNGANSLKDQLGKGMRMKNLRDRGAMIALAMVGLLAGYGTATAATPSISGNVRDAHTGSPIKSAYVSVQRIDDAAGAVPLNVSYTKDDGSFDVYYLDAGSYRVCTGGEDDTFARQCFDGVDIHFAGDYAAASTIVVTDGQTRSGVDFHVTEGGTIRGTIRDKGTGHPAGRMRMQMDLHDGAGNLVETSYLYTEDSGAYELPGIPSGSFYLVASPSYSVYGGTQLYPEIDCPNGDCIIANGQAITFSGAESHDGIDFSFDAEASVAGVVRDRTSGNPLGGVQVTACLLSSPIWPPCYSAISDASDGRYVIALEPGPYNLIAYAPDSHVDTIQPDKPCLRDICLQSRDLSFSVDEGDHLSGRDFTLARASHISGTVTDILGGAPIAWASIAVFDSNYQFLWSQWPTPESGVFTTGKWPSGTYYVAAYDSWPGNCAFYANRPCPSDRADHAAIAAIGPTPVIVGDGETRTGIDIRIHGEDYVFSDGFD